MGSIGHSIKSIFKSRMAIMVLVLVLILVCFYILNPNYIGLDNIKGILISISVSGIMAVGISCLLMGGGIDLAAGAEATFGGVLLAIMLREGMPWPLALLLVIVYGCLAGAINAFFVNVLGFAGFIVTTGMSMAWSGLALVVTSNQNVPISNQSYWVIGTSTIGNIIPTPFAIMLVILLIYSYILTRTQLGRKIYIVGGNQTAARLAGINPKKIKTLLYINCSALSALAGAILAARMHNSSPTGAIGTELSAITAAVLGGVAFTGGTGSMLGCLVGLLILNSFNSGLTVAGVGSYWQVVAQGSVLVLALILDNLSEKSRLKALRSQKHAGN